MKKVLIIALSTLFMFGCKTTPYGPDVLSKNDLKTMKELRSDLYCDIFKNTYDANPTWRKKVIKELKGLQFEYRLELDLNRKIIKKLKKDNIDLKTFRQMDIKKPENIIKDNNNLILKSQEKIERCKSKIMELDIKIRKNENSVLHFKELIERIKTDYINTRNAILSKYNIPPDTCYLHGKILEIDDVRIWGGFSDLNDPGSDYVGRNHPAKDNDPGMLYFPYDGLIDIDMGKMATSRVETIKIEACADCIKASEDWYQKQKDKKKKKVSLTRKK